MKTKPFFSQKQDEFWEAELKRINLLYGSVRSGKTWISLLKWGIWIMQQPEQDEFIMVGKTITTLKRNCLNLMAALFGDKFKYSTNQKVANLANHNIWLEGANDERAEGKIRGMTLKGAYVDELSQIPKSFFAMLLGRLSVSGAVLIATTNPDHPKHYVKTDIIDNENIKKNVWQFLLDDNIFLDEEYKKSLIAEYMSMSPVYYKRFVLGEFVNAEGLCFPKFAENPSKWIVPYSKQQRADGKYTALIDGQALNVKWCEVGFDIGGNGSAYALTCSAELESGEIVVLKSEKRQAEDMAMEQVQDFVKEFVTAVQVKYGITPNYINCDHVDVIINTLNDHTPYRAGKTYKPPLEDRVFTYSCLFATDMIKFVEGECDDLIDELQSLVYDSKQERAIPLDDGSMQIDTYDSLTYSIADNWAYISEKFGA